MHKSIRIGEGVVVGPYRLLRQNGSTQAYTMWEVECVRCGGHNNLTEGYLRALSSRVRRGGKRHMCPHCRSEESKEGRQREFKRTLRFAGTQAFISSENSRRAKAFCLDCCAQYERYIKNVEVARSKGGYPRCPRCGSFGDINGYSTSDLAALVGVHTQRMRRLLSRDESLSEKLGDLVVERRKLNAQYINIVYEHCLEHEKGAQYAAFGGGRSHG